MSGGKDEDLLERRDALAHAVKGAHGQSAHALANGDFGELACVGASNDQFAKLIGHAHGFDNGEAASITGVFATFAATSAVERHAIKDTRIDVEVGVHFGWISD